MGGFDCDTDAPQRGLPLDTRTSMDYGSLTRRR